MTRVPAMPTPNQFNDMVLSIDLPNTTATLTLNGAQVATLKLAQGGTIKRLSANLGLQSDRTYGAVYDNLVLDARHLDVDGHEREAHAMAGAVHERTLGALFNEELGAVLQVKRGESTAFVTISGLTDKG